MSCHIKIDNNLCPLNIIIRPANKNVEIGKTFHDSRVNVSIALKKKLCPKTYHINSKIKSNLYIFQTK